MNKKSLVFDLDGVVCDSEWRTRIAKEGNQVMGQRVKKWDLFHSLCIYDEPIDFVISEMRFTACTYDIHLLTDRTAEHRPATINWLNEMNVPFDHLHMRGAGDFRKASELKSEVLTEIGIKDILLFVDDLSYSVDMAMELGINSILFDKDDLATVLELRKFIDDLAQRFSYRCC